MEVNSIMENILKEQDYKDEPLFINITHMTRERYFEAVKARGKQGRILFLRAGGVIAAGFGLLMSSYTVVALGLLIAVLSVFSHILIGRRDYKRLCEVHPGGRWDKTMRFYGDRIETEVEGGETKTVFYRDIKKELEHGSMYVLEFGKNSPAATFCKEDFVLGTMEELKPFLTEARRRVYDPENTQEE